VLDSACSETGGASDVEVDRECGLSRGLPEFSFCLFFLGSGVLTLSV
jgi:hypothetical protein